MRVRLITSIVALLSFAAPAVNAQRWQPVARGVGRWSGSLAASGERLAAHAVRVDLCARGVQLRVTSPDERDQTTSAWAQAVGAVAATNGDYFEGRDPTGPARGHDAWWPVAPRIHHDALFAWGRGRLPRIIAGASSSPALWFDATARVDPGESEVLAAREFVLRAGATQLSPQISHDGGRHPRTAIGLAPDRRTLWMLVIDGAGESGGGATVEQLASALRTLGASDGVKLDGGGSSTLFVRSLGVVNRPSDGHERVVANHFGVVIDGDAPLPSACVVAPAALRHAHRSFPSAPLLALAIAVGAAWSPRIGAARERRRFRSDLARTRRD